MTPALAATLAAVVGARLADKLPPAHESTITTGGQIIIALIGLLGTYLVARLEITRRQLNAATGAAQTAATAATSAAGVPQNVLDQLGRIEDRGLLTAREMENLRGQIEGLRGNDRRLWDRLTELANKTETTGLFPPHPLRRRADAWPDDDTPPGDSP